MAISKWALISLFVCLICLSFSGISQATMPPFVRLDELFNQADVVAFVQITAADAESYSQAINKAKVLDAFKGCSTGEHIYFDMVGMEIWGEYLVFLKDTKTPLSEILGNRTDHRCDEVYNPKADFLETMYSGYSRMRIGDSVAVDEGREVVAFAHWQIILPVSFSFVIVPEWNRASNKMLVSKDVVANFLRTLPRKGSIMKIKDIRIGDILAGKNWRLAEQTDEHLDKPIEEWQIEDTTLFYPEDSIVYSGVYVTDSGKISLIVLLKEVQDADYGGDFCEFVNGQWHQLGDPPNPIAEHSTEYFANPLAEDPSFGIPEYRQSHKDSFRKYARIFKP